MIGACHDHFTAVGRHCRRDLGRIGGNRHAADPGGLGPPQHMDDHRQAGDLQ